MDENTQAAAEIPSSAAEAPIEIPKGKDYASWRMTGKLPDASKAPASGDAQGSENSDPDGDKPDGEKGAPDSETGKETKEPKQAKTRSNAQTRLEEVLGILKEEDLTPAKLKALKAEVTDLRTRLGKTQAIEPSEQPAKPPERPKRPKYADFEGNEDAYEAAMDKHEEDLAAWKADQAIERFKKEQADDSTRKELSEKLSEAQERYGEEAQQIITSTVGKIVGDAKIPMEIKRIINGSPVLVDLMYVMGQNPEDLQDFIETARANPDAAIRKAVMLERLVMEELTGKSDKKAKPDEKAEVKPAASSKKINNAPPPPEELGGSKGTPADEVAEAGKTGNFSLFRRTANARDLARAKGF
jgi:SepF-like predicted cell division protein (DUF552 family)